MKSFKRIWILSAMVVSSMMAGLVAHAEEDQLKDLNLTISEMRKNERAPASSPEVKSVGRTEKMDMDSFIAGCKHALKQAKPNMDSKDADMLCRDPYLVGKPNESAKDKARRLRLIKETDQDKKKAMGDSLMSKKEFMKECQQLFKEADPGKDPADVKMLCENPYLTPQEGESSADQARRKRLIQESDAAKAKAVEGSVVQAPTGKQWPKGVK